MTKSYTNRVMFGKVQLILIIKNCFLFSIPTCIVIQAFHSNCNSPEHLYETDPFGMV